MPSARDLAMRLLVLIAVSGFEGPLLDLAVRSAEREDVAVACLEGAAPHGAKLDAGQQLDLDDFDGIVCMDSDVVVWPGWRTWIETKLMFPSVAACGAPRLDSAVHLHPSMLAMRTETFRRVPSFQATEHLDTGVAVSRWLRKQGTMAAAKIHRHERGWWECGTEFSPLWWHLGSGSISEDPGEEIMAEWQDQARNGHAWFTKHVERVKRRREFIEAATKRLV